MSYKQKLYRIVKPIKLNTIKRLNKSKKWKYGYNKEELVGFTPNSEYEFVINGERLYRVMNKFITIKYEYQGNEKEYNPSWA